MKTDTTRFRKTVVARALITAFCGTATMMIAQETLAQNTLQRVEITGSNIRRSDTETASPVQVLTREDIEKSGKSSVAEFLQTLAVDNQGSVPTTFGNGFAAGASGLSLRGLGAASTLVLVNGRRVAPYGMADDGQKVFTDLNMLPLEAVERVEVLKDGASSIYGSDAIAGVVNVILRKSFKGTEAKVSYGTSGYHDGTEKRASISHGFGDLEKDGQNLFMNFEVSNKGAIWNKDRVGRGYIGVSDGRSFGFDALTTIAGGALAGGSGSIDNVNALIGSSVVGNVRNPATLNYYSRSNTNQAVTGFVRNQTNANCATLSHGYPQGDPGGGCLTDTTAQYVQIQPDQRSLNFFGRGVKTINANMEAYAELTLYSSYFRSSSTPSGISGSVGYPGGPVSNSGQALGVGHPDNPYDATARLRYYAWDVGPRISNVQNDFVRALVGVKGTMDAWDYDAGFLFSQSTTVNDREHFLQRDVTYALLNPNGKTLFAGQTLTNAQVAAQNSAAYAALPAGSYWRIAENSGLNSAALYSALSPTISAEGKGKSTQIDFKASRELGKLEGGPIQIALGAEYRKEDLSLTPQTGTERGNVIGLGYSAYDGSRNVLAAYGEALLPVSKMVEVTGALRADNYSDVGTSVTPKVGIKFKPMANMALRGTFAEGFRAPSSAENGKGGLAAFSTAADSVRCAAGVAVSCSAGSVALITTPNPALEPEKSKSLTIGMVWDITPKTSLTLDWWQIERKGEINQELTSAAIAAGHVVRDTTAVKQTPTDPGPLLAVLTGYTNSAKTTVRGLDLEAKHRFDLEGGHKVTLGVNWTHLFKWLRVEQNGDEFEFAGTHGNCDVTNCIGTPKDRLNFSATWETGPWRVAAVANYRGPLDNVAYKDDPAGCMTIFANGNDAPAGCKIGSFTTVDLNVRYKASDKLEVTGGIRNLFNKIPPFDPTTYGAVGYNPLDYSGAVGRYYSMSARYKF